MHIWFVGLCVDDATIKLWDVTDLLPIRLLPCYWELTWSQRMLLYVSVMWIWHLAAFGPAHCSWCFQIIWTPRRLVSFTNGV